VTRIVAGSARGRRLVVPRGTATRPTSDRTREGLFSTLWSLGGSLVGVRLADLYAGSGAVGLEALSRGAAHVLFVEADPRALRALRDNVRALGLPGAEIVPGAVAGVVSHPPAGPPYDVVFVDPPYALTDDAVRGVLVSLIERGWLASGAVLAVERASRNGDFAWPPAVEPLQSRRYGEATLWYGRGPC
jgi:16S rRNA (guanine966-N2)-methyltransferase